MKRHKYIRDKTKKAFKSFLKFSDMVLDDVFLLIGTIYIAYGTFKIYPPAGYIVTGIAFIGYAFLFAKRM